MKFSDLPQHHAVLITHIDRTGLGDSLWKEITSLSPAHRHFNQTVLDIETSRAIISFAQSSYSGEKVALISFHTASLPAQNALLKILEDPRENMRFVLLTTHKNNLIDTVLSRVHHIHVGSEHSISKNHAREFLATSYAFRMKLSYVVDMLARVDEEGRKDREGVKGFILELASIAQEKNVESQYVTEILEIASYASDPSASGKILLEYLALLLPQTK